MSFKFIKFINLLNSYKEKTGERMEAIRIKNKIECIIYKIALNVTYFNISTTHQVRKETPN